MTYRKSLLVGKVSYCTECRPWLVDIAKATGAIRRHNLVRGRLDVVDNANPEGSLRTLVERGKVWAVSLRLLKGRAKPSRNRTEQPRTCSLKLPRGLLNLWSKCLSDAW
jgi:hypothetical protein